MRKRGLLYIMQLLPLVLVLLFISIIDTLGLGPDNPITTGQLWFFTGVAFVAMIAIYLRNVYQKRADQKKDELPVDIDNSNFDYIYQEKRRDTSESWTTIFAQGREEPYQFRVFFINNTQRFLAKYLGVFNYNLEVKGGEQDYVFKERPLWSLIGMQWNVYNKDTYIGTFKLKFKMKEVLMHYYPAGNKTEMLSYRKPVLSTTTKAWDEDKQILEGKATRFSIHTKHGVNIKTEVMDPAFLLSLYHLTILIKKD